MRVLEVLGSHGFMFYHIPLRKPIKRACYDSPVVTTSARLTLDAYRPDCRLCGGSAVVELETQTYVCPSCRGHKLPESGCPVLTVGLPVLARGLAGHVFWVRGGDVGILVTGPRLVQLFVWEGHAYDELGFPVEVRVTVVQ